MGYDKFSIDIREVVKLLGLSSMSLLISCWTSFRPSARFRILTEKWRRFESVP